MMHPRAKHGGASSWLEAVGVLLLALLAGLVLVAAILPRYLWWRAIGQWTGPVERKVMP